MAHHGHTTSEKISTYMLCTTKTARALFRLHGPWGDLHRLVMVPGQDVHGPYSKRRAGLRGQGSNLDIYVRHLWCHG